MRPKAKFYSYKKTYISGRGETLGGEYKTLSTTYHLDFVCTVGMGNRSRQIETSDKEILESEMRRAIASGFIPSSTLPRGIPTTERFSSPRTIEGVADPVKVVLHTSITLDK